MGKRGGGRLGRGGARGAGGDAGGGGGEGDEEEAARAAEGLRGVPVSAGGNITDCGSPEMHFTSFVMQPNPPVKNQQAALNATGTVLAAVSTGTYNMAVYYEGAELYTHQGSACGISSFELPLNVGKVTVVGLNCPVGVNTPATVSVLVTLPTIAPSGNYEVKMSAVDGGNNNVFCIDATFPLA